MYTASKIGLLKIKRKQSVNVDYKVSKNTMTLHSVFTCLIYHMHIFILGVTILVTLLWSYRIFLLCIYLSYEEGESMR